MVQGHWVLVLTSQQGCGPDGPGGSDGAALRCNCAEAEWPLAVANVKIVRIVDAGTGQIDQLTAARCQESSERADNGNVSTISSDPQPLDATPVMTAGQLLFAGATTAYILIAIQLEERDLIHFFGDQYRRYRKEVAMLIPLPKRRRPAEPRPSGPQTYSEGFGGVHSCRT